MGFQLFPSGIGWREFSRTLEEGTFECDNPRCKGKAQALQQYRHRRARNWVTILFVPVMPLNICGDYVECRSCKSIFSTRVLGSSKPTSHGPSMEEDPRAQRPVEQRRPSPVVEVSSGSTSPSQPNVGKSAVAGTAGPTASQSASHLISGPPAEERLGAPPISTVPGGVFPPVGQEAARAGEERSAVPPVADAWGPDSNEMTVHRSAVGRKTAPVRPASPSSIRLRFDNGDVVEVHNAVIIGRDPVAPPEYSGDLCHPIADTTMTMSKTHARFAFEHGVLRVRDLGSANGVIVSGSRGQQHLSNSEALVYGGCMVSLGAVNIWAVDE